MTPIPRNQQMYSNLTEIESTILSIFYSFWNDICQQETMQFQERLEINRTYGLSRSNSFTGEIPDEEFKVFMAIAR